MSKSTLMAFVLHFSIAIICLLQRMITYVSVEEDKWLLMFLQTILAFR